MRRFLPCAALASGLFLGSAAHAVTVSLEDTISQNGDTLVYAFAGLPTLAVGDGTLTIETTGVGFDGIDLGELAGEYMDVVFGSVNLGRFECSEANDGGTLIPGATGTPSDCLFSLPLTLPAAALAAEIADGSVTVQLIMGSEVTSFVPFEVDTLRVTLQYIEGEPPSTVPLPATLPLAATALAGLAWQRRRRATR